MKGIQDYYPDHFAQCYGCGRLNEHGHQLKTYWEGENTVTRFVPKEYHTAIPGFVYGGMLASTLSLIRLWLEPITILMGKIQSFTMVWKVKFRQLLTPIMQKFGEVTLVLF